MSICYSGFCKHDERREWANWPGMVYNTSRFKIASKAAQTGIAVLARFCCTVVTCGYCGKRLAQRKTVFLF